MKIKKGNDRIVFVFPKIGIVVKFPIFHFFYALRCMYFFASRGLLKEECLEGSIDSEMPNLKRLLLKGLADNWRELRFYQKTRHPFLQPTYFSLFGFFNVQKMGNPYNGNPYSLLDKSSVFTVVAVYRDPHHFLGNNFCVENNKLRIVDYGTPKTQKIILEWGIKIFEGFKLK